MIKMDMFNQQRMGLKIWISVDWIDMIIIKNLLDIQSISINNWICIYWVYMVIIKDLLDPQKIGIKNWLYIYIYIYCLYLYDEGKVLEKLLEKEWKE